jgi:hypothetical protein
MNQQIHYCSTTDGVRIAYALAGHGVPLVMLASWLTHLEYQRQSLAWKPWFDSLSHKHCLKRYDPCGCGLSNHSVSDISF